MGSNQLTDSAIAILRDLVAFNSVSRNSNLPIIAHIKAMLEAHGAIVEIIPAPDGQPKANLLARLGPEMDGGMVWSGHTDVVPVDGQPWDTDPFTLTQHGETLFGRGTSDMKSFIACALALAPEAAPMGRTR